MAGVMSIDSNISLFGYLGQLCLHIMDAELYVILHAHISVYIYTHTNTHTHVSTGVHVSTHIHRETCRNM